MEENEKYLRNITAAADAHLEAAAALNRTVRTARRAGLTWDYIGQALGTTRQAAQQRFGKTTDASTASREL